MEVRQASYGVELVDALTGQALLGASRMRAELQSPTPGSGLNLTPFQAWPARWVFEEMYDQVSLSISSDYYFPRTLDTDSEELPAVPSSGEPGLLVQVTLQPAPGYPFPPTLTRVMGVVRVSEEEDPATPIAVGAEVTLTPFYGEEEPEPGTPFVTQTDATGQYVAWFQPVAPIEGESLPTTLTITVTYEGLEAELEDLPVLPNALTGVPTLFVAEPPP